MLAVLSPVHAGAQGRLEGGRANGVRALRVLRGPGQGQGAPPTPATHSIWAGLNAGRTVYHQTGELPKTLRTTQSTLEIVLIIKALNYVPSPASPAQPSPASPASQPFGEKNASF